MDLHRAVIAPCGILCGKNHHQIIQSGAWLSRLRGSANYRQKNQKTYNTFWVVGIYNHIPWFVSPQTSALFRGLTDSISPGIPEKILYHGLCPLRPVPSSLACLLTDRNMRTNNSTILPVPWYESPQTSAPLQLHYADSLSFVNYSGMWGDIPVYCDIFRGREGDIPACETPPPGMGETGHPDFFWK